MIFELKKWQYMEKSKFDMHIFYYKNQKIFTSEWLRNKDRYFQIPMSQHINNIAI